MPKFPPKSACGGLFSIFLMSLYITSFLQCHSDPCLVGLSRHDIIIVKVNKIPGPNESHCKVLVSVSLALPRWGRGRQRAGSAALRIRDVYV